MKLKNIFLAASVLGFAVGFNSGDSVYLGAGLPFGAILFGLFMVFSVLEKETALFDKQISIQRANQGSSQPEPFTRLAQNGILRGYPSGAIEKGAF